VCRVDRTIAAHRSRGEPVDVMRGAFEIWESDEPSTRGIDALDRMRLIRDDIAAHRQELLADLRRR